MEGEEKTSQSQPCGTGPQADYVVPEAGGGGLADLLARVEKAEGPDRELDGALWLALECRPNHGQVFDPEYAPYLHVDPRGKEHPAIKEDAPPYTASLDAALALVERVLPGWDWVLSSVDGHRASAEVTPPDWPVEALHYKTAKTPALALLAAMLKALEAQNAAPR